jgi:hypothetical protein
LVPKIWLAQKVKIFSTDFHENELNKMSKIVTSGDSEQDKDEREARHQGERLLKQLESQRQQKLIRAIIELNDELSSMSRRDPEYRSKLAAFAKMGKEMNKVTPQPI